MSVTCHNAHVCAVQDEMIDDMYVMHPRRPPPSTVAGFVLCTRINLKPRHGKCMSIILVCIMDKLEDSHHWRLTFVLTAIAFCSHPSCLRRCRYFSPIAYPTDVDVGLRVAKLGNSSVTYEIGIFSEEDGSAAALGTFVHVYVRHIHAVHARRYVYVWTAAACVSSVEWL